MTIRAFCLVSEPARHHSSFEGPADRLGLRAPADVSSVVIVYASLIRTRVTTSPRLLAGAEQRSNESKAPE